MTPLGTVILMHGPWHVYETVEAEPGRQRREYLARHTITGQEYEIDVSSNVRCNPEMLRAIIDLGFPTRHHLKQPGPLDAEDVIRLLRARLHGMEAAA